MSRRKTLEEFISECKDRFPDRNYDYSKVVYNSNKEKVTIVCPTHGNFSVRPSDFLKSLGCTKCSGNNNFTKEEILFLANFVHSNRYQYDKNNIRTTNSKVNILCKEHGWFKQKLNNHIYLKHKCPKCEDYIRNDLPKSKQNTKKHTLSSLMNKFKIIHNNKYSYDEFNDYTNNNQYITPICPNHGRFTITVKKHLLGQGCSKCSRNYRYSNSEIVNLLFQLEPTYNYSKVTYKNFHSNITVICPVHGNFEITPANFINGGNRCPNCSTSKLENEVKNILDEMNLSYTQQHTFKDLCVKRKLRFDFYIPSINTIIECQGIQHFQFVPHFHKTKETFQYQQRKDKLKGKYCVKNNIKLIQYSNNDYLYENLVTTKQELNDLLLKLVNEKKE